MKSAVAAHNHHHQNIATPVLPQIYSDENDSLGASPSAKRHHQRPAWAQTPALRAALASQSVSMARPEDIFGRIEPVKLEGYFHQEKQTHPAVPKK